MDRGDGPHMNSFDGAERRRCLGLVDVAAQSDEFSEEQITWLRHVIGNGLEDEAIAYLMETIAEYNNASYDNVEEDLNAEGGDQEADDELQGDIGVYQPVIDPLGPPDILNQESDEAPVFTPSSGPGPGESRRVLREEDESDRQMNHQHFRGCNPVLHSVSSNDAEEGDPVSVPPSCPLSEGEESRRRLDVVEDIAQSGQFSEGVNAWLRIIVSHGLEDEAIAYLRNFIPEHDNANIDNTGIVQENLDCENLDQEADDELQVYQPVIDHPLEPPDILRESDTDSENVAPVSASSSRQMPGVSQRWLRQQDEDGDQTSSRHFRCSYELSSVASSSGITSPVPAPSSGPVNEGSSGLLRYYNMSDISDWESDTDLSADHEAPVLSPSSSPVPAQSQRRLREEDESDGWKSSKRFKCYEAVPHPVSRSDTEEEDPESAPPSRTLDERSKKRKRDDNGEEDGSGSKHFRH